MTTAPVKIGTEKLLHPPGPLGKWPQGVLKQFQEQPLEAMMAMFREYGDAIRFRAETRSPRPARCTDSILGQQLAQSI